MSKPIDLQPFEEAEDTPSGTGGKAAHPDGAPAHVLLDTNALRSAFVGESSIAFRALSDLAARGKIFLHLPEVVIQEVRTQVGGRIAECGVDKAQTCFKELRKLTPPSQRFALDEVERLFGLHTATLADTITAHIDKWLASSKVVVHAVAPEHTAKVFAAYYSGGPPFKTVKSREDLPDAFIWQVLTDLAQNDHVHFVCNDGTMAKCGGELGAAVTVHPDIGRLLQSGCLPIKATQEDFNLARRCEGVLGEIEREARSVLYSALERLHFKAANMTALAVDGTLRIDSVLAVVEAKIDPGSIAPIGDSSLLARFSAQVTARVSYDLTSGLPGTFNILETSSVRADHDLSLSGSLLLKPVFGASAKDKSARLALENIRVGLEAVEVEACQRNPRGLGAEEEIDDAPVRILNNDGEGLSRALARCDGLIVITGRRKRQKVRAAESLLLEVVSRHPDKFLLTTYRTRGFLQMGCLPLPGLGEAMNIRRPSLATNGVWSRLEAAEPDGLVVDTDDDDDFHFAGELLTERRMLIIGITGFKDIEECLREFEAQPFDPAAILEAS